MDGRNAFPHGVPSSDEAGAPSATSTNLGAQYGPSPCIAYRGQYWSKGRFRAAAIVGYKDKYLESTRRSTYTVVSTRNSSGKVDVQIRRKRKYDETRKRESRAILESILHAYRQGENGRFLAATVLADMHEQTWTISKRNIRLMARLNGRHEDWSTDSEVEDDFLWLKHPYRFYDLDAAFGYLPGLPRDDLSFD